MQRDGPRHGDRHHRWHCKLQRRLVAGLGAVNQQPLRMARRLLPLHGNGEIWRKSKFSVSEDGPSINLSFLLILPDDTVNTGADSSISKGLQKMEELKRHLIPYDQNTCYIYVF